MHFNMPIAELCLRILLQVYFTYMLNASALFIILFCGIFFCVYSARDVYDIKTEETNRKIWEKVQKQ